MEEEEEKPVKKTEIEVITIDYIPVRPTLKREEIHTLVTFNVDGRFGSLEIDREVTDKDELLKEILEEAKKPRSPLEGMTFEVEKE